MKTVYPRCYRFTATGKELVTDYQKRPRGMSEADMVAAHIAQLGDEGWELVIGYLGMMPASSTLFFKRHQS
jgi:hypothetical protein